MYSCPQMSNTKESNNLNHLIWADLRNTKTFGVDWQCETTGIIYKCVIYKKKKTAWKLLPKTGKKRETEGTSGECREQSQAHWSFLTSQRRRHKLTRTNCDHPHRQEIRNLRDGCPPSDHFSSTVTQEESQNCCSSVFLFGLLQKKLKEPPRRS